MTISGLAPGEAEDLAERALEQINKNPILQGWSIERRIERAVAIVAEIAERRRAKAA